MISFYCDVLSKCNKVVVHVTLWDRSFEFSHLCMAQKELKLNQHQGQKIFWEKYVLIAARTTQMRYICFFADGILLITLCLHWYCTSCAVFQDHGLPAESALGRWTRQIRLWCNSFPNLLVFHWNVSVVCITKPPAICDDFRSVLPVESSFFFSTGSSDGIALCH